MAPSQVGSGVEASDLDVRRTPSPLALPAGSTAWLRAAPGGVVRRVLVTPDAPTPVCAGSRFEAASSDVISSQVHGLSTTGERLRLRCPVAIRRVHVAQAGARGYREAAGTDVAATEMGTWLFDAADEVRAVDVLIGPSTDGGLSLPVRCERAGSEEPARQALRTSGRGPR